MANVENSFDLVVIGSGPGGYVGAIRAAQLGLKTAIVEKDKTLGGTCLNVGCIPSKALLESSEHFQSSHHELKKHGVVADKITLDLGTMMARKDKIVKDLTGGVSFLMKKHKITVFNGVGQIKDANTVVIKSDTSTEITTKNILIATGSVPVELPFLRFDEKRVLSSTGALALQQVPKSMVVVGGGVIGLEMGSVWSRLGTKVTVVEFADRLCGVIDQEAVNVLKKALTKEGVDFFLSTKVAGAKVTEKSIELTLEAVNASGNSGDSTGGAAKGNSPSGIPSSISAEVVLVSIGRKPYSDGLGLENVGIAKDKQGRVEVNGHLQTSVPNIFAIGDVVRGPMLAHKAEEEGVCVAEHIATGYGHINYDTVPSVVYTHPEIATVGLSEEQAKAMDIQYNVGKFPFLANGRAKALGFTDGFVKIIADQKSDRILGGTIVGPKASELLGEIVVTMEFGGSSEDLGRSFHSHPTLSEAVREAALAVEKRQRQM